MKEWIDAEGWEVVEMTDDELMEGVAQPIRREEAIMPRTAMGGQVYDYAASCGKCGQDFVFDTSKERNDWLREHDPNHHDFASFFMQGRV